MFRNWNVEDAQAAGATAGATVTPIRAAQSSLRPASGAKAGTAKTGTAKTGTAKNASGGKKPPGAPKAAPGGARTGTRAGRPGAAASQAKPGSGASKVSDTVPGKVSDTVPGKVSDTVPGKGSDTVPGKVADPVRTGSARGDAAAASPNGDNGARRGLLRLGRHKQE